MRVLMLLLAVAAGTLLLLVLRQEEAPHDMAGWTPGDEAPLAAGAGPERIATDLAQIEIVPPGQWHVKVDLERDPPPMSATDPRIARHRTPLGDSDADWFPTGAQVLDILVRHLGSDVRVRFKDEETLEAFKKARWPIPMPGRYRISLLLDTAEEIGFRFVLRADAIYVVRVRSP